MWEAAEIIMVIESMVSCRCALVIPLVLQTASSGVMGRSVALSLDFLQKSAALRPLPFLEWQWTSSLDLNAPSKLDSSNRPQTIDLGRW